MKRFKQFNRLLAILMVLCMIIGLLPAISAAPSAPEPAQKAAEPSAAAVEAMRKIRAEAGLIQADPNALDPDETIRVIVTLDAPAAAEKAGLRFGRSAQTAEAEVLRTQAQTAARVESMTGSEVINRFGYLVNGFSIEMKAGDMAEISKLPGVASVSPVTTFELRMNYAAQMTTVTKMWEELGYDGEGTVIAVVDTGVNYNHPDMKLDEGTSVKITEDRARELIDTLGYGAYYNEKVPFAYSYVGYYEMDNTSETHGLHVSGIAAANGGEDGVTGVAPNAQVLGLQVFGTSGSAHTDDIIRAVEDAAKLDADVVNLSLGSTAGFYDDVAVLQRALQTVSEAGILCCVAAGNDGTSASLLGLNTNDFGVIDTGAVSAPSTAPDVLSVASLQNEYVAGNILSLTDADGKAYETLAYNFSKIYPRLHDEDPESTDWALLQDVRLIDCGLGSQDDVDEVMMDLYFGDEPYYGEWVALVERGELSFREKIQNCIYSGASGIIIYNNEKSDAVPFNVSAENAENSRSLCYALMVSGNFGQQLKQMVGTQISFTGLEEKYVVASDAGEPSTFSSWGPTPSLDIKPEIAAPGGNIYSLSAGDGYETMSGTSMATPYVSGASALVIQAVRDAVDQGRLKLGDLNLSKYVKLVLMNTADPVVDKSGVPFSVRQQGAGMVDPVGAALTTVTATVDGLASAALRNVGESTDFTITLHNYGTEDKVFAAAPSRVTTDVTGEDGSYGVSWVSGASLTMTPGLVTVPAGGEVTVTATLHVGKAESDHFVEAFARFESMDGDEAIGLPVLGFYGDWYAAQSVFDAPAWEEDNIMTDLCGWPSTAVGAGGYFTGMDSEQVFHPECVSFSPDGNGVMDNVWPLLGMMRSVETIKVEVTDAEGEVLRVLLQTTQVPKILGVDANGEQKQTFTQIYDDELGAGAWDGTVFDPATSENNLCPEGQYVLRITGRMPGAETDDVLEIPFRLDLTSPAVEITDFSFEEIPMDEEGTMTKPVLNISFRAEDNVGVYDMFVLEINSVTYNVPMSECELQDGVYSATVDYVLPVEGMNEVGVYAEDYGGNSTMVYVYSNVDQDAIVSFSTLTNAEDSWFDSFFLVEDYAGLSGILTEEALETVELGWEIRGVACPAVRELTVDGEVAEIGEDGSFNVPIRIHFLQNQFHVVAKDEAGQVIFDQIKLIYCSDGNTLKARFYPTVYLEGEEAYREMVPASFRPASSWTDGFDWRNDYGYDTMYDAVVPMTVEVDSEVDRVELTWFDPDVPLEFDGDELYDNTDHIEGASYVHLTLTAEDFHQDADGLLRAEFDLPMAVNDAMKEYYELEDPDAYSFRVNECFVTTYDRLGQMCHWLIRVYNKDLTELMIEMGEIWDSNILEDSDSIETSLNFTIDPLDSKGYYPVFTPDELDENGAIHFSGAFEDEVFNMIYANGGLVSKEDQPNAFEFDYKPKPGVNYLSLYVYEDNEYLPGLWTMTMRFYYLPEPTEMSFDNAEIQDGAVIITSDETFEVAGVVTSYVQGTSVSVNGDNAAYLAGPLVFNDGKPGDLRFTQTLELELGENPVTVERKSVTGETETVSFTVVRALPSWEHGEDEDCPGKNFVDMPKYGNWAHQPIDWAIATGLTNGTDDTHFSPNKTCTRGQVVTFLWRAMGSPEPTTTDHPFTDVKSGAYYYTAMLWAVENGITSGTTATTFGPNKECTRAQVVTFLWRVSGEPEPESEDCPFTDVKPTAGYRKAVLWAVENGITNGTSATTFSPNKTCTRAQVVTFLYKFMES